MKWSKVRGTFYAVGTVGTLGMVATLVAATGLIDYDPATRLITIPPFTVDALVALVPTVVTALSAPLATIAVFLRWGARTDA